MPKSQTSRQNQNQPTNMENVNLHKQKLYALIIAAVGLISCFLPWWHVSYGGFGGLGGGISINGLHKLGIISFIAFIAAGVVTFAMGDKTKPYMGQEKTIAAACFGGAVLFTLITLLANSRFLSFGIFIALVAGIAGAVVVWGLVKVPDSKSPMPPGPPPPHV